MGRHADNIPLAEAQEVISGLQAYPTWALEIALLCRAQVYSGLLRDQKYEDTLEEAADKLNILDYLDLARKCKRPWPANDGPSVLKSKVDKEGRPYEG